MSEERFQHLIESAPLRTKAVLEANTRLGVATKWASEYKLESQSRILL